MRSVFLAGFIRNVKENAKLLYTQCADPALLYILYLIRHYLGLILIKIIFKIALARPRNQNTERPFKHKAESHGAIQILYIRKLHSAQNAIRQTLFGM